MDLIDDLGLSFKTFLIILLLIFIWLITTVIKSDD